MDSHAITIAIEPAKLRGLSMEAFTMLLAVGLTPEKSLLFFQSHVHQHTELAWILDCYTQFGELSRMTQFKDKSRKNADNINAGLFTYPSLMAADILLYDADLVPVGEDQKQHVELTRTIAERFNHRYGDTFVVPEPMIPKVGARVMSLQSPADKMGKSEGDTSGTIFLLDKPDDIRRKFRRAVTDSEAVVRRGNGKSGIANLMAIYGSLSGKSYAEIEQEFDGRGYGDFKEAVGECVAASLAPIQQRHNALSADKAELARIYREGAERAAAVCERLMRKVRGRVGFVSGRAADGVAD
ncbi:MAG: tryptophan--tRNA ligase [Firmicutes bacterium]|nr:tryptophan--tRNA ligase [Bacillota bacterium]